MGGMQTFQWIVSYPDFMDKAVPIVGTPQLTSYDELLWAAEMHAIESDPAWNGGDYTSPPPIGLATIADMHALTLTSPRGRDSACRGGELRRLSGKEPAGLHEKR